jgi:anhydro-N-acetylmuramic acid kinase
MDHDQSMRVIGLISGTSYDGIDVAAAELWFDGDALNARLLGHTTVEYEPAIRDAIGAVLPPHSITVAQVAALDTGIGQAFARAAVHAIDRFCGGSADLVVSHGQTVFHWLQEGRALGSLQIGQPAWIAERSGLPVVSDLRNRDIAAGGQGAPLVAMFDMLLLAGLAGRPAALNIGGIANLTVVPTDGQPLAYDTGPGNALIDAAVLHYSDGHATYDLDGARAAAGRVHDGLLKHLLDDAYYRRTGPKSTGKEHFHLDYLLDAVRAAGVLRSEDVIATVTELTAATIAAECRRHRVSVVIVSGGGADNPVLMRSLASAIGSVPLLRSDEVGVPAAAKEAMAFAVLGFLTVHGVDGTMPACTGATRPVLLGTITPGRSPLVLPPPAAAPRCLTISPVRRAVGHPSGGSGGG